MSRVRRHVISVSLFPFLAVLICIMGALVIILVLMVARVGDGAKSVAGVANGVGALDAAADEAKLRERLEDAQWQRKLLEKSRVEKTQELADKRAELSHLEDHIQRLQQQAQGLLERARTIDEGKQLRAEDLDKARKELARLQAEATEKKKQLDEKNAKRQSEEKWYALIPYDGPNGTRRRPIYIECDELGITIQPEGVVFRAEDFLGPLGPGNPLDAALRKIREQLAQDGSKAGEPYPLLVVRPGGVVAYAAARAALKSWDDEFGYELVGDDKRLDYGEPDSATVAALENTIRIARQRQALLAAAMPRNFGNAGPLTSFADEPGVGRGGAGGGGGSAAKYGNGFGSGSSGNGGAEYGGGGSPSGVGTGGSAGSFGEYVGQGAAGFPGPAGASGDGGGPAIGTGYGGASAGVYPGGLGSGSGRASGGGSAGGSMAGSSPGASTAAGSTSGRAPGGNAGSSATGMSQPGGAGAFVMDATTPGSAAGHMDAATPGGAPGFGSLAQKNDGMPLRGGSSGPTLGVDLGGSRGRSGSSGQSDGNRSGGTSSPGGRSGGKMADSTANSKSRRPNWAVPNARVNSMAVTRPIHVQVLRDRLVIVPEAGEDRRPQQFPISPRLAPQEVDAFVAAVQKEMQSWGLAVQNGFWRPQIIMDVAPSAEQQCSDLQMALEGSGFDLQRKLR